MPLDETRKNILVTGTGGRSVGAGILHAITRCSADIAARWNVIAADADPFAWGLYKVDNRVLLPLARDANYISQVQACIKSMNIHAVIPGTESEAAVLSEHSSELSPAVLIANRAELMPFMLDKFSAARKLRDLGCEVIPTVPLQDWQQLLDIFGFPIIVKPTRGSGGSRGVHLVMNQHQLNRLLQLADADSAPCAQPYIGSSEQEYTVGVLSHFDGTIIDSIVMRRKLIGLSLLESKQSGQQSIAVSTGYSQGFIVRDATIQDFCERLALKLDSRGPLNIQLRIDERSGKPLVFELHSRFSGTTPIRADVGFNEVDLLLRDALFGERFGRVNYRSDVAAIRAFEHVIVPVSDLLEQK